MMWGGTRAGMIIPHLSQALSNQQKAVLMSERVMGIEHPNTIQEYVSSWGRGWGVALGPRTLS